ncbi:MAG TPA: NlpC/P60 family protein [Candidatus Saccharimonadales bacterium]|nr:NlpC/P60 family protein [Candidatus Saccharimonadales bacterium]
MSEFGNEILERAESRIDAPFKHHFKPINLCEGGQYTVPECMERGMGPEGYDCSGLAIASIAEVLHIEGRKWPKELRHTQQLAALAIEDAFEPGDIRLFYSHNGRIHLGIATESEEVVHASGLTGIVEKSVVTDPSGSFEAVKTIPATRLSDIIQ